MEVITANQLQTEERLRHHKERRVEMGFEEKTRILLRPGVRRLLSWVVQGHEKITSLHLKEGDRFPEVTRLLGDSEQTVALLEELASRGIFRRVKAYSEPACPDCKSTDLSEKYVCPFCEGEDLDKGERIQHHGCGHVDLETRFQKDGELICPRCGKELRLIGTDYQRIENIFRCNDCSRDFSIPKIVKICNTCNNPFPHEKAELKPIYGYTLNEERRTEIIAHCLIEIPLTRLLESQGYDVVTLGILKGRSGIEHLFDIVAERDGNITILDLIAAPTERDKESILNFFAKSYDVPANRAVLIAVPNLSEDGKQLAETYGIEYLEGTTITEAIKGLPALFNDPKPGPIERLGIEDEDQRELSPNSDDYLDLLQAATMKSLKNSKRFIAYLQSESSESEKASPKKEYKEMDAEPLPQEDWEEIKTKMTQLSSRMAEILAESPDQEIEPIFQ